MTSQSPSELVGPVVVAISRMANRRNLRLQPWRKGHQSLLGWLVAGR